MAERLKIFLTINGVRKTMIYHKVVGAPVNTLKKVLENLDTYDFDDNGITIYGYCDENHKVKFNNKKCTRKMKIISGIQGMNDKWGEIIDNDISFYSLITRNVSFLV